MKIAVVQPRLSYFSGGGEKLPLDSIYHLVNLVDDISFDLYTTDSILPPSLGFTHFKSLVNNNNRVKIYELPIPKKFIDLYRIEPGQNRFRWDCESLFFNNIFYQHLEANKPDLILSYYLPDCIVKPCDIPSLLYLQGYPRNESEYREAMISQYDGVISISQNTLEKWNNLTTRKINSLGILPQGLDINSEINPVNDFDPKIFHIVFAGRLIERKGVMTLLESTKLLNKSSNKFQIHICGEGPMLPEIETFISQNKIKNIILEGYKPNILDYISSANLCVFPSYEGEGLMHVVLESLYYNGLVITTTGSGNEEVIVNNSNGFLIEPHNSLSLKDKIIYVMENYSKLRPMKQKAKETIIKKFTWKNHVDTFMSICQKFLNERIT